MAASWILSASAVAECVLSNMSNCTLKQSIVNYASIIDRTSATAKCHSLGVIRNKTAEKKMTDTGIIL